MPNLGRMVKSGVSGELQSVLPTLSAPAWVSFMTGKYPDKHGILDFVRYSDERYSKKGTPSIVTSREIKEPIFWDIIGQSGKTVGVMNVPVTYPPREVNGFLVSSFLSPSDKGVFTYPPDLSEFLRRKGYKIDIDLLDQWFADKKKDPRTVDTEDLFQEQLRVTRKRSEVALWFMENRDPDLFMVVLRGTDTIQHYLWEEKDRLADFYSEIDSIIGEIRASAGESANVLVMSDHGFGPYPERTFNINSWLREAGYLKLKKDPLRRILTKFLEFGVSLSSRLNLFSVFSRRTRGLVSDTLESQVDWSRTHAYADSQGLRGVNLNLAGRESSGTVKGDEEFHRVQGEIVRRLRSAKDPKTGEAVFKDVLRKERLYSGPYLKNVSDVVLVPNERYLIGRGLGHTFTDSIKSTRTGIHTNTHTDGMFVASGPAVRKNLQIDDARLVDIAPTILYLMGCSVPTDMDGRVLTEVFREKYKPDVRKTVPPKEPIEGERIKSKVRELKSTGRI